jgi:hypothetical protein
MSRNEGCPLDIEWLEEILIHVDFEVIWGKERGIGVREQAAALRRQDNSMIENWMD